MRMRYSAMMAPLFVDPLWGRSPTTTNERRLHRQSSTDSSPSSTGQLRPREHRRGASRRTCQNPLMSEISLPYFLALPEASGPWPGVVVIHEGGGITSQLLRVCERLAGEGYAAIAPDLF